MRHQESPLPAVTGRQLQTPRAAAAASAASAASAAALATAAAGNLRHEAHAKKMEGGSAALSPQLDGLVASPSRNSEVSNGLPHLHNIHKKKRVHLLRKCGLLNRQNIRSIIRQTGFDQRHLQKKLLTEHG